MKKILHKLTYAQNPSQCEAHSSYHEEILCRVLTAWEKSEIEEDMRKKSAAYEK